MKFRNSDGIIIDSRTLIRLEWRGFYPAFSIHEKYEKHLKWLEDLGFMANEGTSVGIINMCFTNCVAPFEAYKELLRLSKGEDVYLDLIDEEGSFRLVFRCRNLIEPISLENIPVNRKLLNEFLKVDGGGEKVIFVVGYPPAEARKLIIGKEMSPLIVAWSYSKL